MGDDKDKIIALQRKKIEELNRKISALEQENALLSDEISRFKKAKNKSAL